MTPQKFFFQTEYKSCFEFVPFLAHQSQWIFFQVFVVQHVDVCMFSNGKFKNIVALVDSKEDCPLVPYSTLEKTYNLLPVKSTTKNWIALEDSYTKSGSSLSSTVTCTTNNPDERNVFAIYVSYYVKVKLIVSVMSGDVSLKLPFTLMHSCSSEYYDQQPNIINKQQIHLDLKPVVVDEELKSEKDGTWEMEKVLVEVNNGQEQGDETKTETVLRVIRRASGCGKVTTENFDEIITEKREEHVEDIVDKQCNKEKGFSIQRAWCCLMNRRTS